MKALMFGWEFPPHILGGLGTASYGLTKGMHANGNMEITFVIPKPWGDEERGFARIIGATNTPIAWRDVSWDYVNSRIGNVMDPQTYFDLRDHIYADFNYMRLNDLGCIEFSGRSHHPCPRLADVSCRHPRQERDRQASRDPCARVGIRPFTRKAEPHGIRHRERRHEQRRPHMHRLRPDATHGDREIRH